MISYGLAVLADAGDRAARSALGPAGGVGQLEPPAVDTEAHRQLEALDLAVGVARDDGVTLERDRLPEVVRPPESWRSEPE